MVHDVALRFVQQGLGHAPVLDRQTGELAGMLTAFDLLKAKDWEHMQEMQEPASLWGRGLGRPKGQPSEEREIGEQRTGGI